MFIWNWFQPLSFQIIWLASVLGGNQWLAVPLCILALHFALSPSRAQDLKVISLALIGITTDSLLTHFGVFNFEQIPLWLWVLWAGFVLNFGHSMKFLRRLNSYWLILLGAVGGCYSYIISWKLGAVNFPFSLPLTAGVLVVYWAIIFPILVKLDIYLRGDYRG